MKMTELTVLRDDVEWKTRLDGKISEVEIDGRKISDVHDLTQKVISMTKTIKVLALTATSLALMAVVAIAWLSQWLIRMKQVLSNYSLQAIASIMQCQTKLQNGGRIKDIEHGFILNISKDCTGMTRRWIG